ncbi:hypothetical protein DVH24_005589 [Malus domestica]|uniref:Vacuolar protein 8 n=1 Tax=Malus domestica TaxID=3750 RepID=A0A498IJ03_MALDO|nr:hypothetical protein DVH24_005589 [Malus domestica]
MANIYFTEISMSTIPFSTLGFLFSDFVDKLFEPRPPLDSIAPPEKKKCPPLTAGGLTSLLMLLRSFEDETVRRVAAGAIVNLAMNGGISLLVTTSTEGDDAQTLRMVAGAIANLWGDEPLPFLLVIHFFSLKLQMKLRSEGGIKALLGLVRCGHPNVLSQMARGMVNFAKYESRHVLKKMAHFYGLYKLLMMRLHQSGTHIELPLCHLAQHEVNAKDMISGGALWELMFGLQIPMLAPDLTPPSTSQPLRPVNTH